MECPASRVAATTILNHRLRGDDEVGREIFIGIHLCEQRQ